MVSRLVAAGVAVLSLSACDHGDKAAIEADQTAQASTAATSPAEAVLVEVWQTANPGQPAPDLDNLSLAFDPGFVKIQAAENDADNASITSTLAFIKAVQAADPKLCAEAPLARFRPETLTAVPAEALPAFRTMLTDRLALIAQSETRTAPPEDLMSGSMQNFSQDVGEDTNDLAMTIGAGQDFDPAAGCKATIKGWEALDKATQSPQLYHMLYGFGLFSRGE